MAQEEGIQAQRVFEQPADAISFYSEFAQVVVTETEVLLQFYETIPGSPGADGKVQIVTTRLRATVMLSRAHARRIGEVMRERLQEG